MRRATRRQLRRSRSSLIVWMWLSPMLVCPLFRAWRCVRFAYPFLSCRNLRRPSTAPYHRLRRLQATIPGQRPWPVVHVQGHLPAPHRKPNKKPFTSATQIFITSSSLGSMGGFYPGMVIAPYGMSKAAANYLALSIHHQTESVGAVVVPYNPGMCIPFSPRNATDYSIISVAQASF